LNTYYKCLKLREAPIIHDENAMNTLESKIELGLAYESVVDSPGFLLSVYQPMLLRAFAKVAFGERIC
jgi:hypothetical protein